MLDPKIVRDEPEKIRKMLKDRAVEFDFEKMLEFDKKRRYLIKPVLASMLKNDYRKHQRVKFITVLSQTLHDAGFCQTDPR